eukprot:g64643.t1
MRSAEQKHGSKRKQSAKRVAKRKARSEKREARSAKRTAKRKVKAKCEVKFEVRSAKRSSILSRKVLERMSKDRSPPVLPNCPLPRPPLPADYASVLGVNLQDLNALSVYSGWSRLGLATFGEGFEIPLTEGALHWGGWHGTTVVIDPKEGFSFVLMLQCHGWSLGCFGYDFPFVNRMLSIAAASLE